jgi:hypothetical protein
VHGVQVYEQMRGGTKLARRHLRGADGARVVCDQILVVFTLRTYYLAKAYLYVCARARVARSRTHVCQVSIRGYE